ncbi:MAG: hypothetical protein IJT91_06595 [Clostridia bacterium]|nr:hypothetical protein [Clostridia bacterium]
MPYISTKTTVSVSKEKETVLKEKLARALEKTIGKGEAWLMLSFEDNVRMWFKGGNSAPCAMIEIKIFGSASASKYEAMTAEVCRIMNEELGVPSDRVYVKYEECEHWGWNGSNF